MVGSAPPSARDSLPGVHAGRESQRGDLENLEGRSLASPLARDEGRFEQSDRWVLPNGAEAYRQFSGTIRLLLARWQNTSVTSTFVVAQIQILVCRTYRDVKLTPAINIALLRSGEALIRVARNRTHRAKTYTSARTECGADRPPL